jgi:hypothetical protein
VVIRLNKAQTNEELIVNVDHISTIEVEYPEEADGENSSTSLKEGADNGLVNARHSAAVGQCGAARLIADRRLPEGDRNFASTSHAPLLLATNPSSPT